MRRVPFLLALLALSACLASVRAKTSVAPKCTDYGQGRSVRVCTELDESALSGPGRSTTWRVWVEGDGNPIQVRLHNNSPAVVRLKGGDDQIVHMGCRRHHEVRRKVTAIGMGQAKLAARPYSESTKQEAASIAAALAPRLAQIEARFIERRAKLRPDYPAAAVSELLDSTETELLEALDYQELAALRDYVREKFRRARAGLERPNIGQQTGDLSFPPPRAVLASLSPLLPLNETSAPEPPGAKRTPQGNGESALTRIGQMLRRLSEIADSNDMIVNLCLTSDPAGAWFKMRPQSYKQWLTSKSTAGEYREVYRGLYIYSIRSGIRTLHCINPDREDCGPIDLVDDPEPIFHCDFQKGDCERRSTPLPREVCHGNEG
jgi:hypothetical protein